MPDAELLVVPDATHMTLFSTDPAWTNATIRRFLATVSTGG